MRFCSAKTRKLLYYVTIVALTVTLTLYVSIYQTSRSYRNEAVESQRNDEIGPIIVDQDEVRTFTSKGGNVEKKLRSSSQKTNVMLEVLQLLRVTPVILQPELLEKLQNNGTIHYKHIVQIKTVGVLQTQMSRLKKILNITSSHPHLSVSSISRYLPMDVSRSTSLSRITCYLLKNGSITYSIIVMYQRTNFLYIPSCLDVERYDMFTDAVLGQTPMVLDSFAMRTLTIRNTQVLVPVNVTVVLTEFPYSHYYECRRDMADNFSKDNESPEAIKDMMEGLLYIKNRLKIFGKFPFLAAGTLLGWYRHCSFIARTGDIDVAMFSRDLTPAFHDHVRHDPNIVGYHFNLPKDGYQYYLFVTKKKTRLDLFFLYDTKRSDVVYAGQWAPERMRLRTFFPRSEVCSGILLGYRFNIPCRIETLLEAEYGDKWKLRGDYGSKDIQWPMNMKVLDDWNETMWKKAYMDIKSDEDVIE